MTRTLIFAALAGALIAVAVFFGVTSPTSDAPPPELSTPPTVLAQTIADPQSPAVITAAQLRDKARAGEIALASVDAPRGWVMARSTSDALYGVRLAPAGAEPDVDAAYNRAAAIQAELERARVPLVEPPVSVPGFGTGATARSDSGMFGNPLMVITMALALGFLTWMMISWLRRRNGSGGSGSGRGRMSSHTKIRDSAKVALSNVRFDDVAGCEEAVEELSEVVEFMREPATFASVGARMPRGVILFGPPGTGKTLLAKAVAGEAKVPFFAMSGSDFVELYVGTGAARMRDLFGKASKSKEGAVIFIDEIDAIGKTRSSGPGMGSDSERDQTLNQLLVQMDGFATDSQVMVIAATNRLDMLDKALLRPGRFDRHVRVDLPAERGRLDILRIHAANKPLEREEDLVQLAKVTAGMSGADLANVLNEAAIMAGRDGRASITYEDLMEGQLRAIAGPLKRDSLLAEGEREVIAYHEAGHCLVAELSPTHHKTQRVTILPRGRAAGLAMYGAEDRALHTPEHLHERMMVALGGRAAEQIVFGRVSSGAANDLEQVNGLARQAVEQLGFSAEVGQLTTGGPQAPAQVSGSTRERIDSEVMRMADGAYRDALALLDAHRDELEALAQTLLSEDTLDRERIIELLGDDPTAQHTPTPALGLPTDERPAREPRDPRSGPPVVLERPRMVREIGRGIAAVPGWVRRRARGVQLFRRP